ncbi:MarR family winged helix-turn-helix transcriptional regulator [Paenibacillus sp. y28]|uniref:MarR family winged helix-turn-helix transcriptional regulator n=1 Tax=Paenibacillus sp. y28 TaxID=3129110 RepID=UPI00301808A3
MSINDSIGFMMSNTSRRMSQLLNIQFQPYAITTEQFSLLNKLVDEDGITQRELSFRIEKDPTNVTRMLDQLERKGWIRREANRDDRRSFLIYVTDEGRRMNEQLAPIEAEFVLAVFSVLSEEERTLLKQACAKVNQQLNTL